LTPLFSSLASAASSSRTPGVLELASGQGTHVSALARAFSTLRFSPCEADASLCSLINDACSGLSNVAEARVLEIEQGEHWAALQAREEDGFEAVLALNLVHIIPAPLVRTLFERVAEVLKPGGTLVLYGAYNENGKVTSEGNAAVSCVLLL
jgi:SAM-dependent methyltransferase